MVTGASAAKCWSKSNSPRIEYALTPPGVFLGATNSSSKPPAEPGAVGVSFRRSSSAAVAAREENQRPFRSPRLLQPRARYSLLAEISPPLRVTRRANSRMSIESLIHRTEPSPMQKLAPPGWKEYGSPVPTDT